MKGEVWSAARFTAIAAVMLAAFMTAWDWLENPGGIFRSADGTNWQFVYDTAISWLLPSFGWIGGAALLYQIGKRLFRSQASFFVSSYKKPAVIGGGHDAVVFFRISAIFREYAGKCLIDALFRQTGSAELL